MVCTQLECPCLCVVLPCLDVTNVQCELNKLKLEPLCPPAEPLRASPEEQPLPAALEGANALFHKPWTVKQGAHPQALDTIAETTESSSSSSTAMSIGALNSTAGNNLVSSLSPAISKPLYSAMSGASFNPFKPEAVQFMLSGVAGNPMPRVDEVPPEPLEQGHIDVGMQVSVCTYLGPRS